MTTSPTVHFENEALARSLTEQEIADRVAKGAIISNTASSILQAKRLLASKERTPDTRLKPARHVQTIHHFTKPIQVSDPSLDRSDETAIAINPQNPLNIVAGAATFDGQLFTNSAYVSMDTGQSWQTITALEDTNEGAGLAFDDSGNCYYATLQGGFFPVCTVSQDGGLTWGPPAQFGSGDKTAVAARGQIALVGFDRLPTEACAFTLDGGQNWTVHDFTDSGAGTAPLVSYDHQSFYIIYAALDNNLKFYASHDQGQTWIGPTTIVAGNAPFSTIAGPLSYETPPGALTSPGTNVAIDGSGTLHVLYIDSSMQVPMYTSSSNQGITWSTPVNVNPLRATDPHMWPCLSCNKSGDLLGGSLLYDQASGKYSILQHRKPAEESNWTTFEVDTNPWLAAGPSPNIRIGFGDYFDCDSLPYSTTTVMAWSETPNGLQPWQSWARILEQ